jgi:hypothetical protein
MIPLGGPNLRVARTFASTDIGKMYHFPVLAMIELDVTSVESFQTSGLVHGWGRPGAFGRAFSFPA